MAAADSPEEGLPFFLCFPQGRLTDQRRPVLYDDDPVSVVSEF
jgi:hypothetical protein